MDRKEYDVLIKLVSNQNPCHVGHKIGQEWLFDYMTPAGMCSLAFNAIYPMLIAFKHGAVFPWQEDPDIVTVSCPDSDVNNVFELKRIIKK